MCVCVMLIDFVSLNCVKRRFSTVGVVVIILMTVIRFACSALNVPYSVYYAL